MMLSVRQTRARERCDDVALKLLPLHNPVCVFTAFLDFAAPYLTGRLYAGSQASVKPEISGFRWPTRLRVIGVVSPATSTCKRIGRNLPGKPPGNMKLGHVLIAPIFVMGRSLAKYFVGGIGPNPSSAKKARMEAIAGHVGCHSSRKANRHKTMENGRWCSGSKYVIDAIVPTLQYSAPVKKKNPLHFPKTPVH
jgi:hypothetical protein